MLRGFTAMVMLVATLAVAAVPQLREKTQADNALVGRWEVTKVFTGGIEIWLTDPVEYTFASEGELFVKSANQPSRVCCRYNADNTVKPAALTFIDAQKNCEFSEGIAIYQVTGDEVIVAWGKNKVRLQSFDIKNQAATAFYLKRVKDK